MTYVRTNQMGALRFGEELRPAYQPTPSTRLNLPSSVMATTTPLMVPDTFSLLKSMTFGGIKPLTGDVIALVRESIRRQSTVTPGPTEAPIEDPVIVTTRDVIRATEIAPQPAITVKDVVPFVRPLTPADVTPTTVYQPTEGIRRSISDVLDRTIPSVRVEKPVVIRGVDPIRPTFLKDAAGDHGGFEFVQPKGRYPLVVTDAGVEFAQKRTSTTVPVVSEAGLLPGPGWVTYAAIGAVALWFGIGFLKETRKQ